MDALHILGDDERGEWAALAAAAGLSLEPSAASGRVVVVEGTLRADAEVLAAHREAAGVVVGALGWAEDAAPNPLATYLDDAPEHLDGRRRLLADELVREPGWRHVSLPASRWSGPRELEDPWQAALAWDQLLRDGAQPRFAPQLELARTRVPSPGERLQWLLEAAEGAAAAYEAEPDALAWLTEELARQLAAGRPQLSPDRAFQRMGQATNAAVVRGPALLTLERQLLAKDLLASEAPLPLAEAWREAGQLLRTAGPAAACAVLEPLLEQAPLHLGGRVIRLWLDAKQPERAQPIAERLLEQRSRSAAAQLLAAEVTLAAGQLAEAEQLLTDAFELDQRELAVASQAAALFRRHGPAPAARPYLERALALREGRSARDIREHLSPLESQLEALGP